MIRNLQVALMLTLFVLAPAYGQITIIPTPTAAYTGATTLVPITAADHASVTSITNGTQTISFSSTLMAATVPSGGWGTWSTPPSAESATPRVLSAFSALTTLTVTLSQSTPTFGFEIEPMNYGFFTITITFMNGNIALGSVTQTINGEAGAPLAAMTSAAAPITGAVITLPVAAGGLAVGQFRYGPVSNVVPSGAPALGPAGMGALSVMLMGMGSLLARMKNRNA